MNNFFLIFLLVSLFSRPLFAKNKEVLTEVSEVSWESVISMFGKGFVSQCIRFSGTLKSDGLKSKKNKKETIRVCQARKSDKTAIEATQEYMKTIDPLKKCYALGQKAKSEGKKLSLEYYYHSPAGYEGKTVQTLLGCDLK